MCIDNEDLKMKKLLIYGASYPDIFNLIDDINMECPTWDVVGVLDDTVTVEEFMGYPIIGNKNVLNDVHYSECFVVNNVFSRPSSREHVACRIMNSGRQIPSLIHPSVTAKRSHIGQGVIVMDGVRLGARTVLGDHVTVRYNAIINHDNVLEPFVFVGPGATLCGHVVIGRSAYIGAGSVIREHLHVGADAFVGMGSVVIKNVHATTTVFGNPAVVKE